MSLDDDPRDTQSNDYAFDLTNFAEASLKIEGSLQKGFVDDKVEDKASLVNDHEYASHIVDPTTHLAGAGNDVNVFEDFDDPIDALSAIKSGVESQSLSSRLIQKIGV